MDIIEPDVDLRKQLFEPADVFRHLQEADRINRCNPNSANDFVTKPPDGVFDRPVHLEEVPALFIIQLSRGGQFGGPHGAVEQRNAKVLFELLNDLGGGGLGDLPHLRRFGKTAAGNDVAKQLDVAEVHDWQY